jgi:hypothetical protein
VHAQYGKEVNMNRTEGFMLLLIAVVLIGYAGGLNILSVDDWLAIDRIWAPPEGEQLDRVAALIFGGVLGAYGFRFLFGPRD